MHCVVKKKHPYNTNGNRIITIFKAPKWILQRFSSATYVLFLIFTLLVFTHAETAFSKRPLEITFGTQQTLNLFPTQVNTTDWAGIENVLIQDLTDTALYQDFGARTSAYVPQEKLIIPSSAGVPTEYVPVIEGATASSVVDGQAVPEEGGAGVIGSQPEVVAPIEPTPEQLPVETQVSPEPGAVLEPPANESVVEPVSMIEPSSTAVFAPAWGLFPLAQLSVVTSTETAAQDIVDVAAPTETAQTPDTAIVEDLSQPISGVEQVVGVVSTSSESAAPEQSSAETTVTEGSVVPLATPAAATVETEVHEITLSNFGSAPLEPGQFVNGMRLTLSLAAQLEQPASGRIPYIEVLYGASSTPEVVGMILLEDEVSNALNGGYFFFALPTVSDVSELADKTVTLRYHGAHDDLDGMFLDAVWLEIDTRTVTKEDLRARGIAGALAELQLPSVTTLISEKSNFRRDENPIFNLRYNSQRNFIVRGLRHMFGRELVSVESVEVRHRSFGSLGIEPELTVTKDGLLTIEIPDASLKNMRPGAYEITLTLNEGGREFTDTFDFQWGILTMNPNKSEYQTGETAHISIGALTPNGHTICEAALDLYVTDPTGIISRYAVNPSGQCNGNNVVDVPDFSALVPVVEPGVYELYLERLDDAGAVLGFTTDTFNSVTNQELSIERTGPTRIYPPAPYPMTLTVSTTKSFIGTLTETVPASFGIYDTDAYIVSDGVWQTLTWDLSILGAGKESVSYRFDAPDISPYLFTLGPARLDTERVAPADIPNASTSATSSPGISSPGTNVFIEHRRWQIASDAVGKMLLFWPDGATVPAGWLCVSCTSGEPFFQRFVMGSSTYNTTGGAATHTHTATGSVLATSDITTENTGSGVIAIGTHTHTYTPTISAVSNLPAYRQLRVIRYDAAAGEPPTIPAGAIGVFDVASSSLPSGWNRYAAQDGRYIYGENTPGTTGGSNTHTHTITGTVDAASGGSYQSRGPDAANGSSPTHTHTVSSSTGSVSNEPPYIEVLLGQITSDAVPPNGLIAMWDEAVDSGWLDVSSGPTDPFNQRFLKASTTYGGTNDTRSHAHSNVTGLTSSVPSVTVTTARAGSGGASDVHTHSVSVTDFSISDHLPPYLTVVFGKRQGNDPVYQQVSSRWYTNTNAETPTDAWPSGALNLIEREPITATSTPVKDGDEVRLRLNVGVLNATSTVGSSFKLQYAAAAVCSTATGWADVGDTASTTLWRGYNNTSVNDHVTLSTLLLSSSTVTATYEENGYATSTPNNIPVAGYGEWDFVLQQNGALAGTNYCFRLVENDGTAFLSYTHYPQLYTNEAPAAPALQKLFDNEKTASTTPWFYFLATDAEGEKVHYEIEIDNDFTFASPVIDRNTISNSAEFENQVLISDKAPFRQGELIEFIPTTALSNGTTYYWRVRGQDPEGSADWGEWSTIRSFTIDNTLDASAWYQTQDEQFDTNILAGVQTGSDQMVLISGSSTGSMISTPIDFTDGDRGTAWDSLVFADTETTGSISYQIQYLDNTSTWTLVPESALPGNGTGFGTSPVSLLGLDVGVYSQLRIIANFTNTGGSPSLQDWTLYWGYRVETPIIAKLFPNEQVGTTTPSFEFRTSDPQSDSLTYQIQWSLTPDFAASTTRSSDVDLGFSNIDAGADLDPFNSDDSIQFTLQSADALTGTTTYWWRVRAKDTTGDNAWSFWTDAQSFTVIPGTEVSTWFQTTEEQFASNILSGTIALASDAVSVATTASEAMIVYGEGTETAPRYRQWDGTNLSTESTLLDIGAPTRWAVVRAATTREEYVAATVGTDADVNVQVFATGEWGNQVELTTNVGSVAARGIDVAYETTSGDALVVYCDGDADPSYYLWDGTSWTSGGTINLASTNNCEWIKLASDPVSNEIILMARDSDGTVATSYELQVWNGSAWGNSTTQGGARNSAYETMALGYEASGGQALSVSGDGNPIRFEYNSWNGTAWAGLTTNTTITDNLIWAELSNDDGTDNMAMCYVNESTNIGAIRWNGTAWTGQTNLDTAGNSIADRSVSCVYETTAGRDGNLLAVYSDTTNARYQVWNGTTWSAEASIGTITSVSTIQAIRTGAGSVLGLFYDDVNDRIDFSAWNGTTWSTAATIEANGSVDAAPYGQPFFAAPRNDGTEGTTIVSPGVDFNAGVGPYWKTFSWNDTVPGTSQILYHLQYQTATGSWAFIQNAALPGNEVGTTTGPFDLSALDTNTYNVIRPYAELSCDGSGNCPSIEDWKIEWAGGITISGAIQGYDQSTNVTSGTVAVSVNGVLQTGKTGAVSGGTWSISNVTVFPGDVVSVFVTAAADSNEAVAIARYDGQGDMDGLVLYERHLTLGSNDATTTPFTNADIGLYDSTNTEDVFFAVTTDTLSVCAAGDCTDAELFIKSGAYYTPGGRIVTHDFENNGTFTAGSFTHEINGSWDNNATTTMTGSAVVFAATSTTETIDSTGAVSASFNNTTFGTTTGSGVWNLPSELDVNGNLTVSLGTLARGSTSITIGGNLVTGANGYWTGIGTTTFDGGTAATWNDQNTTKQNVGRVVIDGTSKAVSLAGNVATESVTIGTNDTFDASTGSYDIMVYDSWLNQNNFVARSGEVIFAATSSGKTITTTGDAFYDLSFTGVGGGWSFTESTLLVNNDLTIATGTVTLPTATTTIAGSFNATGGSFAHNNGTLYFTSAAAETITFNGGLFTNVAHDLTFNGGGSWTVNDTNATSTNDVRVTQGTLNFPTGVFAIGGTLVDGGGVYTGGVGTVLFYSSAAEVLTPGGSSFNNVTFAGSGSWSFSDSNVDANGDLVVQQGILTLPNGAFTLGGSYDNNATVVPGTGVLTFDAAGTGRTVDFGASSLYDVDFNSATGGWTVTAPATTTRNFSLTNTDTWTLASGQVLSVAGTFSNSVGGASTTWTGSALSLEAGSYSLNTKTNNGDTYETVRIAAGTNIAMWNSSAASYTVDAAGSLYSQDHAGIDGDLYIFGAYTRGSGTEYWSYTQDFDGASLSGSERQVDVRFASGASATFSGATVEVIGTSTASTTIANQGAGTYAVNVSGGTTTAQYYEFADLGLTGVTLSNAVQVSELSDGSYTVAAPGGTALTLSSTTIDANPGKQIFNVTFATTTVITATNVTQNDGVPSSFWWFRDGYGNLYGEGYDNDTGDPGSVRFDDSSLVITIVGTVYSDAGTTPIVGGTCDGITPVVRVMVGGVLATTTSCSNVDGSYTASGVVVIGDPTVTVFLNDASGGQKGSTITRTPTGDILDMDIYTNRVIVRNEDIDALTIGNLAAYDSSDDADLRFSAATSTSVDSLNVFAGNELFVFASSTFTPGGVVTLAANTAANSYDGTLYLAGDATFNAHSTSTVTIGGRLELEAGAVFNAASTTVLMNATTSGKSITAPSEIMFNELVFNGVSGGWNLGADIRVNGDMTITAGTVTGTGDIYLPNGSLYGNGVLSLGAGTTTLAAANSLGGNSAWTFYDLELGDTLQVGTTTPLFTSTTTVSGRLTINAAHYLDAGNTSWDLSGAGIVFVENGTFIEDTSTIRYSGAGASVLATQYYNLDINAGASSQTYIATGLGLIVDNDLTIGGDAASTFDLATNDPLLDVNGDVIIHSNGTLAASDTGTFTIAGSYDNNGVFTSNSGTTTFDGSGATTIAAGSSSFGSVLVNGTGNVTVSEHATATSNFTLNAANTFTVSSGQSLAIGTKFFNAIGGAATTWTDSTLRLYGGGNYSINVATTSDTYATLDIEGTTQIRMWNSDAATYDVASTGSLYSQDHASVDGDLYIWGAYNQTNANDYWSYVTDFDGAALGSPRKVDVYLASGASVTVTGGTFAVFGGTTASTTIQNQGSGSYGIVVGGNASSSFEYAETRDMNSAGLTFTGGAKVNKLSYNDFSVSQNGGTTIMIGGTVITANPAKNFTNNRFWLDGVGSGFNVTATGTSVSSWRFVNHYGDIDGESFDVDPNGDPGYVAWDNSAALITISGNVYSDEGSTVSGVCDGTTGNIRLVVAGLSSATSSCNASTGYYQFTNVAYGPTDPLIVYIDGETEKGTSVTKEPVSNINDLHVYENRIIVRHENTDPMTVADMAVYDSSDDADVPFTAVDSGTDTLTLPTNRKLLVWTNKEFAPNGNVTVSGGGAGAAYDGTLELQTGATWSGSGAESLDIGGSLLAGSGAAFVSANNGTTTFTTTGANRTIDLNAADLNNAAFTGSGSWTVTDTTFTVGGNFTQTNGVLTFPTATTTFGGSLQVSGGSFNSNNGITLFNGSGAQVIALAGSSLAAVQFVSGNYSFSDTAATTTKSITILGGTVTLPSGTLTVGGDFENVAGVIAHNTNELIMTSTTIALVQASSSDLYSVRFTGGGAYEFTDDSIALLGSLTIDAGAVQLASGTLSIGGTFDAAGGTFDHATGTILFNSADGGEFVDAGVSPFYNVSFSAPAGGYTLVSDATTTNHFTLSAVNSFTTLSGTTLVVQGVFLNQVGGANTNWAGSTLVLDGANAYTVNTKIAGGDQYDTLIVGENSDIRFWNSAATTTTVNQSASVYSQDHASANGSLYIFGDFHIGTTTEYWSYATDFDGSSLTGSERLVTVAHATNATTSVDGGTLRIVGITGNETTITNQGTGTYALNVSAGTLLAQYYKFRNLNIEGLALTGTPVISSLAYGDFELAVSGGTLMTVASTTLNANASMVFTGNRFATTTAITGYNVTLVGSTSNAWTFVSHTGNLDGEDFDADGVTACGSIRWSDSACLLTQQTNYRWRNDDGGLGVPNNEWYDASWDARTFIRVRNVDATSYTDAVVKVPVTYDSDMQADFDDLRFTAGDGTTVLSHWLGSSTDSIAAEVWVKIPTLAAESTTNIFMYYNNPSATTISSSTAVFIAADDFETGSLAAYSGQTSLFTVGTTFANDGVYGLDNSGDESGRANTGGIYRFDQVVGQGETFRYAQYVDTVAGSGDETCTLFGVQSPGSTNENYAVCIEQFGTDRLSLVRDAIDNDTSGVVLASTTVSYATGWYTVEVDWGIDDSFLVSLYDASGTLVATTSATDSNYSTGGIGFTYWFHYGGWDSVSSRPTLTTEPTILLGVEQTDGGATWKAAQNTAATYDTSDVARLRFAIENTGLAIVDQQFLLEYASMDSAPSCEAVDPTAYISVPVQASCGTAPVCMQSSTLITNGAGTIDLLTGVEGVFVPGEAREDPTNITSAIDIDQNQYTELEYAITPTTNVTDENLCFRVTDNGAEYDTYLQVAQMNLRFVPVVSTITLNDGQPISLLPGTTTRVYATGTVSDLNGYADLVYATSTIYRGGVAGGASCTPNNNNCYVSTTETAACSFVDCLGESCTVECFADIYFHADPTDAGDYVGQEWFAFVEVEDATAGYDFATSPGVTLSTLRAIEVNGAIDYGALAVNADTGSYNASTSILNLGNVGIDIEITGTDLSDGLSSVIPVDKQKFATSTFTYSACGASCELLSSTTPVSIDVDLGKPATDNPPISDDVYWGIAVPIGVSSVPHQGINVFTPVTP